MKWNLIGAFVRNNPFGTEIAFRKGLERIGETVRVFDPSAPDKLIQLDPYADATVIFKWLDPSPLRTMLRSGFGGKKIVYQVDDLRFPHIKQMMQSMRDVCTAALTFDNDGAMLAREYGYKHAQRLLLTADNTLYRRKGDVEKDIDVSFIGSLSHGANHASRMKMIQIVQSLGLKFVVKNEMFDIDAICDIYNRSKIVLNHATDVGQPFGHGFGYQCRHFEAGFSGACVLSNEIDNENVLQNIVTFNDENSLRDVIQDLLSNNIGRSFFARDLYEELWKSHLPEHRARDMCTFVRSLG